MTPSAPTARSAAVLRPTAVPVVGSRLAPLFVVVGCVVGWASMGGVVMGCTVQSPIVVPDAGPFPDGSQLDATLPDAEVIILPPPTIETCTAEGMGATVGEACGGDGFCDDGCFCNGEEVCESGVCVAGDDPCADDVDCTVDACLENADRCFNDPQHAQCSDGAACNGTELCDPRDGCVPAVPLYCNDEDSCTIDICDDAQGCVFQARDLDGDGFTDGRCGGDDCDDDPRFGTEIYPGAAEDCFNRRDDDCDGSRDFTDVDCVPTNDTCASAQVLDGPGVYSGATRDLAQDYDVSCSTSTTARDAIYRFTLDEEMNVSASLSGGGSNAVVAIRPFEECATGPDVRCSRGNPPSTQARSLPPGEYAVIVQTPSPTSFDLSLQFDAPTSDPPGDTCGVAIDITDGPGMADLSMMLADTLPSCSSTSTGYREANFYFDLDTVSDVTVSTQAESTFHYGSLSRACGDLDEEMRCWSSSTTRTENWRSLPVGRYYVALSTSRATGNAVASVEIRPPTPIPPNDRCEGALMLASGMPRFDTTIDFDDDEVGGTCAGTTRPDAFYTFTLSERSDVDFNVRDEDGTGTSTFYLSLKDGCGGANIPMGCRSGSAPIVLSTTLEAGTYILMVESPSGDRSDFRIVMNAFPAP